MQIAHISDLHVVAEQGPVGLLREDVMVRAHALIGDLNCFEPGLDLVVISGDTVNDARADEYEVLAGLLAHLRIPYLVVPGNHDDRKLLRTIAAHQAYSHPEWMYHKRELDKVRILALDTLSPGEIGGRLLGDQLTIPLASHGSGGWTVQHLLRAKRNSSACSTSKWPLLRFCVGICTAPSAPFWDGR